MKLDYRRMPFFRYISSHILFKSEFRIDYIGGFEANGFAYFATRQPKYTPQPDAQPIISKVFKTKCFKIINFSYSWFESVLKIQIFTHIPKLR